MESDEPNLCSDYLAICLDIPKASLSKQSQVMNVECLEMQLQTHPARTGNTFRSGNAFLSMSDKS